MFTGFSVRHFEAGACVVRPGGPGRPPADVSSPEMGIESRNMMILMVGLCWFMLVYGHVPGTKKTLGISEKKWRQAP